MIRLATSEDSLAIATIHVASWLETYTGIIPASYLDTLDVSEKQEIWTKVLQNSQPVYIAEVDGQVVGFASGGKNRDSRSLYLGELYAMYMLKKFHKKGIGKKLFEHIKSQLTADGMIPFTTFVLADNPTLGFYTHMGAEVLGEHLEDFDGCKLKELQLGWK